LSGPKLPDLLAALLAETSVPWYRLLYVYSAGLTERLVELVARSPRIVPYIDMPIQHAADRMLERMRRPERQGTLREKLGWLRAAIPDLAIRTTCLVAFPAKRTTISGSCWHSSRRRSSTGWARSHTPPRMARARPSTRTTF